MLPEITAVVIMCCSYHINPKREFDEVNPGVIVETGPYFAGTYRNSFNRQTFLIGGQWLPLAVDTPVSKIKAGAYAAAVTGYPVPILAGLTVQSKYVQAYYVPKYRNIGPHTIGLGIRIPF